MMHRATGRRIDSADHLRQSVTDIITTPIGSRVMRRTYGSLVPALIDQPHNTALQGRIASAAISAITRWEPRIIVRRVQLSRETGAPAAGTLTIAADVKAAVAGRAQPIELEVAL